MKTLIKLTIQILIFGILAMPLSMCAVYLKPFDICPIWWSITALLYGSAPAIIIPKFRKWFDSKYNNKYHEKD